MSRTRDLRRALEKDYDLEGRVGGLERPDIPRIDISNAALAAFATSDPLDGLALFAKRTDNEEASVAALELIRDVRAGDKYDAAVLGHLQGLFGAKVEPIANGYNTSDLGRRVAGMVDNAAYLLMISKMYGDDTLEEVEELKSLDPKGTRHSLRSALRLLDKILPLDQNSPHNPECDYVPDMELGRHWVDFVDHQANLRLPRDDSELAPEYS